MIAVLTRFFLIRVCPCAVALGIGGCMVGPDYVKPDMNIPPGYKENGEWKVAQPMEMEPHGPWWTVYRDPQLDHLMDTLNRQSPTIAQAEAQYRQSQALLRQAEAGLFPSLSTTVSDTRATSVTSSTTTVYDLEGVASWELDLWGGIRRSIEAGKAGEAAGAAQLAAIKLSSQVQLATAYLHLVVADHQVAQLKGSENTFQATLDLTRNQYKAGTASEADLAQAESQLKAAQAQRVNKELGRAQLEHSVAVLMGLTPAELSLAPVTQAPHLPQIPPGLPSTLLERRPDIAAAERNVAQANAKIGVTKAAFFPTVVLSASGGYRGSSIPNLITLSDRVWSLGVDVALALFDGGLRKAQTDEAIAAYDASVAGYRQTVLTAFQEVEDNLVAQAMLEQQASLLAAALSAAHRAETITLNQYRAGTVSYANVLLAQNSRFSAENNLLDVRDLQYSSSVALISAVGGQW